METPQKPASAAKPMARYGLPLGCLAIGLILGYGMGRVSTGTPINPLASPEGTFEDGYAAAKRKLADSGLIPTAQTAPKALTGTVREYAAGRITLETFVPQVNPLDEQAASETRVVTIGQKTEIVRRVEKSPEEMRSELERLAKASGAPSAPPEAFKDVPAVAEDITVGAGLTVTASADALSQKEFEAERIVILDHAPLALPAPQSAP